MPLPFLIMKTWPISVEIITPPDAYPIGLTEAKAHLRVDHDDEDSAIQAMIGAATDYVAGKTGYTGCSLMPQTIKARYNSFGDMIVPYAPVIEIESIISSDGALDASVYDLIKGEPAHITLNKDKAWPVADDRSIYVQYRAGYVDKGESPVDLTDNIPTALKQAILLIVGNFYEHREGMALVNGGQYEANPAVKSLMNPYRITMGM